MTTREALQRLIAELPEDQLEALDGICRRDEISRAEAIRQAVALLIKRSGAGTSERAFGLWRNRPRLDGLRYQERLRREWGPARRSRKRP